MAEMKNSVMVCLHSVHWILPEDDTA